MSNRIKDLGRKIFLGMEGVSYGRVDIRMNDNGDLYFLEMNPNCGIFYTPKKNYGSADFILHYDPIGH